MKRGKKTIQKETHKNRHIFYISACCRKRLLFGKGNAAEEEEEEEEEEGSSSVVFVSTFAFFGGERDKVFRAGLKKRKSLSI